jgi:hypothetical protein
MGGVLRHLMPGGAKRGAPETVMGAGVAAGPHCPFA